MQRCYVSGLFLGLMLVLSTSEAPAGDKPANPAVVVLEARKPSNLGNRRPDTREWFAFMSIQRLVFSGDGTRLVASSRWGVVVWDVTTGKVVFESPTPQPEARLPIMSEANLLLLPTRDFTAIDLVTGTPKKEKYPRFSYGGESFVRHSGEQYYVHPHAHSMAPDGSLYAVVAMQHPWGATSQIGKKGKDFGKDIGLQPDQVVVTELRTGKVKFTLTAQLQPLKASEGPDASKNAPKTWTTAFSNDSKYLAACTADGCVTVWEMDKGTEVAVFRSIASYPGQFDVDQAMMVWVGDHDSLIVPGAVAGGFFRCNLATKKVQPLESKHLPKPAVAKKSEPGKKLGNPGKPLPPPPADGQLTVGHGPDTGDVYAFSRDGRNFVKTSHDFNDEGKWLLVSDLANPKAGGVIPGIKGDRAWSLGFSPDSQHLAIGTARGKVLIYRVTDFYELARKGALLETGLVAPAPSVEMKSRMKAAEALKQIGADISGYPVVLVDCSRLNRVTDATLKEIGQFKSLEHLSLPGTKITDAGLKELKELKRLKHLDLNSTQVSDAGLKELSELANLERLELLETKITDAGLKELKGLKNLRILELTQTQVTDAGLKELRELKNLRQLGIGWNNNITDRGLKELKDFNSLEIVGLTRTKVTNAGVKQLRAARPKLIINWQP